MARNIKGNSTVCIFGGSGFIGEHLVRVLIKEDGVNVRVLSRCKDKLGARLDNVQVIVGDLMDLESLVDFLRPDAMTINLAYLNAKPMDDNLRAMQNLARACVEVGVARLIHCSTAAVVGRVRDDVITEDTVCCPVTVYEKTKFAIENILLEVLKDRCEVVMVRPTAVFGEHGQNLVKLADELVTETRLRRMIKMSIYSRRRMNLVCVENVVGAILFLAGLKSRVSGQRYIVSDDDVEENNYYDVARLLAEHLGIGQVSTIHVPFQPIILSVLLSMFRRTNTNAMRIYSSEKLVRLGFRKAISFQDEIQRFASWYKRKELRRGSGPV